jgi:hypothetical protein
LAFVCDRRQPAALRGDHALRAVRGDGWFVWELASQLLHKPAPT